MNITFSCDKDERLARHYAKEFGPEFSAMLPLYAQMNDAERYGVQAAWKIAMLREARRQEHYDFEEVNDGDAFHRRPIVDVNGKKVLLIPDIDIDLT